ncbi:rasGTPase-activating protein [Naegleria gruberi]|uniref:RasGTPase-activating protein n=1 Tax=Naegleria gruberi TaxID=5762 RepID=D2V1S1_NAEGR|nr:rasGTPase-activating protein [Naegleria gruberi]EFC49209.1 rasGTPase-activating protein [Naegleria gruberi]|eukprot:XP_002681953.1 rasGTPase-activating protein [Naegleria gruberi strain NEG-M]
MFGSQVGGVNDLAGEYPTLDVSTPRSSGGSFATTSSSSSNVSNIVDIFNSKEKLIVIVDSIDNYKNSEIYGSSTVASSNNSTNDQAGVYVRVNFDNQVRITGVKTFYSNTNPWNIKLGKRVIIPYGISALQSGKLSIEVFETQTGEAKVQIDKRLGKTEPIKINVFDMNHPVEFSLNLSDDVQVQFRFMRAPLANKGHYKAMERSIYSLLLKMKQYGENALSRINNPEEDDDDYDPEKEEEEISTRQPKILKSGFMLKRGQGNFAKWARRYIELDDTLLLKYYASDSEEDRKEPLGIVVIDSDAMVYVPRDEAMEKELQKQKNIEKSKEFVYYNQALLDEDDAQNSFESIDDLEADEQQTINIIRRKRRELERRGPMLDLDELYPYYLLASSESERDRTLIIDEIIESIEKEESGESVTIKSHTKEERKLEKFLNLVNPKGFKFSLQCQTSFSNGKEHNLREHQFITDSEEARKEWITAICEHILLEEKRTDLRDPEEEIHSKIFPYLDFFELLTTETPLQEVVRCFNSFQLNVSEKMVAPLLTLFDASDSPKTSVEFVKSAISVEVDSAESAGTLFRRNSLSSKLVTLFFKVFGLRYLTKTIKPFLMKLIKENKSYEIDDEKVASDIADKNAELLKGICDEVLNLIINSKYECPPQIREVLAHTFEESEQKYAASGELCVGGLLFLRFFCPALVTPQLFGLIKDSPPKNVQRTLTLLTKILQNIANQIRTSESKKEKFMKRVEAYTGAQIDSVKDFLRSMSEEPKKYVRETKEIVPDLIKLQSLEFIAHHFGEAFTKKYYNFENDIITEATFHKFANRLALISKAGLDKKIKQLSQDDPNALVRPSTKSTSSNTTGGSAGSSRPNLSISTQNPSPSKTINSPTTKSHSPHTVSSPKPKCASPSTSPLTTTDKQQPTTPRGITYKNRSPSVSVNDVGRLTKNVKKIGGTEWDRKRERRAGIIVNPTTSTASSSTDTTATTSATTSNTSDSTTTSTTDSSALSKRGSMRIFKRVGNSNSSLYD